MSFAELAGRVDFFSIGTNDLTQFLLAMDISNPWVQGFNDSLHPAVVHVVGDIVQRATVIKSRSVYAVKWPGIRHPPFCSLALGSIR